MIDGLYFKAEVYFRVAAWKSSKAKDTYGPIVEFVKKQQDLIKKTGLPTNYPGATLAITKKPGTFNLSYNVPKIQN